MSRLDDELKRALGRQEPSPDFLAGVLAKINEQPAPRPTARQRLASLFGLPFAMPFRIPKAGFAAAALLLLAIAGAAILNRPGEVSPERPEQADAATPAANQPSVEKEAPPTGLRPELQAGKSTGLTERTDDCGGQGAKRIEPRRRLIKGGAIARRQEPRRAEPEVSAEAEAAKVRVLFALQMASSTLKEAQRVIQEDSQNTKPDPVRNR